MVSAVAWVRLLALYGAVGILLAGECGYKGFGWLGGGCGEERWKGSQMLSVQ